MSRRDYRSGDSGGSGSSSGSVGAPQIIILTQTQDASVIEPATATFTIVAASVGAITYQWQKAVPSGSSELTYTDISGATSASYTTGATDATTEPYALYRCVVTSATETVTSSSASLTVIASPSITTQPTSVSVLQPATATFTVVAGGTEPITYQWQLDGVNIGGATSASYTTGATSVAADDGDEYQCVVTNAAGSITSAVATLTVTAIVAPTITIQPSNVTVTEPASPTFSLSASGSETLTYQWYKLGVLIVGATASSYTTPYATSSDDNGDTFYCIVSNSAGSVQSNTVTLTVLTIVPGDVTAPTISVSTSPTTPLTTDPVTLTATFSDASGIASASISIDNTVVKTGTVSPLTTSGTFYSAGDHTYFVTVTDNSSNANVGTSSGTFTVLAVQQGGGGTPLPISIAPPSITSVGVDGGIVFPKGLVPNVADPLGYSLGNPTQLRLMTNGGVEVPANFRTLAVWSDASVKSVLVSALRDGSASSSYTLFYGSGCTRSTYAATLNVSQTATQIIIDTGVITAKFSKSAGYLFEQIISNGSNLLSAPADIVVRDNFDATLYKSSNWTNPTYTFEEQDAVKIILKHTGTLRSVAGGGGGGTITTVTKQAGVVDGTAQYSAISAGWTTTGTEIYAYNQDRWVEYSVNFGAGGTSIISMSATNQPWPSAPGLPAGYAYSVNVAIDSIFKGTISIPGSTSSYQSGSLSVAGIASGTHTVRFTWTNDAWLDGSYDANIRIASVSFVTDSAGGSVAGNSVDYIARYTFYASSDLVDVQCTVVDTTTESNKNSEPTYLTDGADTNMARSLSAWYLQIPYTLGTQTYTYGTTGTSNVSGSVSSEHYMLQTGNDNMLGGVSGAHNLLLERETGTVGTDLNGKGAGWGVVADSSRGITAVIQDFWRKYPHGFRVQSNNFYIDLHPQRASDKVALADPNSNRFQRPRTLYFPRHGDAYTEKVLLAFHTGTHRGLALSQSYEKFEDRPAFITSPQWICDSKAMGNMIPTGADSVGFDDWMDKSMNRYFTAREALGGEVSGDGDEEIMYGKRDNGCSLFYGSNPGKGSTSDRRWKVNLNDTHIGMGRFYLTQWARSGNVLYKKAGFMRARHFMDHDISHCNRTGTVNYPSNLGPGEPHNRHHNDSQLDHTSREFNDNHGCVGGLPQYYLLTGDLRALDVLKEVGSWMTAQISTTFRFQLPFSAKHPSISGSYEHRDWAWSPWILLEISRVVDNTAYRTALGRVGTFLQQWFRQTGYAHVQAGATVHSNSPSTGRAAWYLPGNSANNSNATTWNGGSCWMHFGLIAVAIQMFEEGKDYSTIWGGYTAAQWLDMLLQNIESAVRHSYKPTVGHTFAAFSSGDRRKNGSYWLYDESRIIEFANEYGKLGNDGGGAPTTFVNAQVLGGGGSYALAWGYDKLTNGDSSAGAHANPEWFTTQAGSTKYWQQLSYDAYTELKVVRTFSRSDEAVRVFSNGWYGYEPIFLPDFFTIARNIPAVTGGGVSAPNISFSASSGSNPVAPGTSVTLSWTVTNTTTLTASGGWSGSKTIPSGTEVVAPTATTTYSLTAVGSGGTTGPQSVTVNVQPSTWVLAWSDEFNGPAGSAPNSAYWELREQADDTGNGAGGNTWLRTQNIALDGNSNCVITMKRETFNGYQYTSGRMRSRSKFFRKYGAIEFRAKWSTTSGMWPGSVWMQGQAWQPGTQVGQDQSRTWTGTGEFDIAEWKAGSVPTNEVLQNFINCNSGPTYGDTGWGSSTLPSGTVDQFHVYRLEWLQTGVKFLIADANGNFVLKKQSNRNQHFSWEHSVNNTINGVNYVGKTYDLPFFFEVVLQGISGQASGTFPATMTIDYIRWYDHV